ncbi:tetratricopeptide repeat protein [Caulobacter sp. CCG-8]|uniref:tetratricopeptide repeat protein n=1 Tax=Caulobacter sp. CCG-8 TaxID=3127958 RepID=UPI00307E446E
MEATSKPADAQAALMARLRGASDAFEAAAPIVPGMAAPSLGDAASAQALDELKTAVDHLGDLDMVELLNGAIRALHAGDYGRGEALALEALGRDERQGIAWHVLGVSREKLGDFGSSMRCYEAALQLLPDHGPVAGDLGRLAFRLGLPELAVQFFTHFLASRPGDLEAINNLACALRDTDRSDEAIELVRSAIMQNPGAEGLWNTLGTVLVSRGDGAASLTFFDEALRLLPTYGKAYHNRAFARQDLGDAAGALEDCEAALRNGEEAEANDLATMRFARATALLALGRLREGWEAYEARLSPDLLQVATFVVAKPRWTPGESLAGKRLLVCGEQGLGDEVLFANVLRDAIAAVGDESLLSIVVEYRLVPLFKRSFPKASVTPHRTVRHEGRVYWSAPFIEDWSAIDLWTPMASLLTAFRSTEDAFPRETGYLVADPERVAYWRDQLAAAPGRKVGLLWKSLSLQAERGRQFSPFEQWRPILQTPGVTFVNLQYGDCEAEIALARERFGVEIWEPRGIDLKYDLDDVAALCRAVDLTIGFSNATFNLAGACGAPVWLLTGAAAWTRLGAKTYPWYPQARVFSPPDYNDWSGVMAEVAAALAAEVS